MKKMPIGKVNDTWEVGSTNVFADLEMPDSDEKLAKAELALKINQLIKLKKLKQIEAAELLEATQSQISLINRGRLADFSMERLVKYLTLLDQDVEIVIKKKIGKGKSSQHGRLRVVYA